MEKIFYKFLHRWPVSYSLKQVITITVVAMAPNMSPFCSLVCKLSKYIWLLGVLLHRNTVTDFLMHSVLG